jgi:hypothetical protein
MLFSSSFYRNEGDMHFTIQHGNNDYEIIYHSLGEEQETAVFYSIHVTFTIGL